MKTIGALYNIMFYFKTPIILYLDWLKQGTEIELKWAVWQNLQVHHYMCKTGDILGEAWCHIAYNKAAQSSASTPYVKKTVFTSPAKHITITTWIRLVLFSQSESNGISSAIAQKFHHHHHRQHHTYSKPAPVPPSELWSTNLFSSNIP